MADQFHVAEMLESLAKASDKRTEEKLNFNWTYNEKVLGTSEWDTKYRTSGFMQIQPL